MVRVTETVPAAEEEASEAASLPTGSSPLLTERERVHQELDNIAERIQLTGKYDKGQLAEKVVRLRADRDARETENEQLRALLHRGERGLGASVDDIRNPIVQETVRKIWRDIRKVLEDSQTQRGKP